MSRLIRFPQLRVRYPIQICGFRVPEELLYRVEAIVVRPSNIIPFRQLGGRSDRPEQGVQREDADSTAKEEDR